MYLKKYKDFLPESYIKEKNKKKLDSEKRSFIFLVLINIFVLITNLNMENKINSIKINSKNKQLQVLEEVNYLSDIEEIILVLESIDINNFTYSDGIFTVEMDQSILNDFINKINKYIIIENIQYLRDNEFVILEGILR